LAEDYSSAHANYLSFRQIRRLSKSLFLHPIRI